MNFAKGLARDVGTFAKSRMNTLDWVETKSGFHDVVTNVDFAVEKMVKDAVATAFPEDSILGEETGTTLSGSSGRLWIVDPIDGTTNFSKGIPHSCVSIALVEDGKTETAVVYDPYLDELFEAVRGNGAFLNGRKIRVSGISELNEAVINTGYQYNANGMRKWISADYSDFFEKVRAMRIMGSAVLDQCYVAAGRIDGFWEYGLKPWDVAAGNLIASEAGAVVTGINEEFSIYGNSILTANGPLAEKLLEVLRRG